MKILGIESSCDESGIAIVEDGRKTLFSVLASQIDVHSRFGGVVPEIASRQHLLAFPKLLRDLFDSNFDPSQLDAIAVTYGPGLSGSLLVGVNIAKSLALSWGLPIIGINHLEGHVYANWIRDGQWDSIDRGDPLLPAIALIVSGGHTDLLLVEGHDRYKIIGQTRDDAAGEAFDKVARILGLNYPGGPEIERIAKESKNPINFPRPAIRDSWDFSFSGLKSAVLRKVNNLKEENKLDEATKNDVAAGFQNVSVEALTTRLLEAANEFGARSLIISGGVAANQSLRESIVDRSDLPVWCPRPSLCTDNAVMVAARAGFLWDMDVRHSSDLDAVPNLRMPYAY